MKIYIRVFPIADLFDATQELEVTLSEGSLGELMTSLNQLIGTDLFDENIMILHNGHNLDKKSDTQLSDEDHIWVMPYLSGG